MTALRKEVQFTQFSDANVESDMLDGHTTEAFTSSLVQAGSTDGMTGENVALFTSSLAPTLSDIVSGERVEAFTSSLAPTLGGTDLGDGVEMFTSSLAPTTAEIGSGDKVEAFTSSLGPVRAERTADGEATGLFTSSL